MDIFNKLAQSPFRSQFSLGKKELNYLFQKGIAVVKKEAYIFIEKRIKPAHPYNDGKQTPMKNHPVFVAQHATATCCRKCLEKWHHISRDGELTNQQVDYTVDIVMKWIDKEAKRSEGKCAPSFPLLDKLKIDYDNH